MSINQSFNDIVEKIFSTKQTRDIDGNIRKIDDSISRDEAFILYEMFKKANTKISIEVGLAHGVSALIFCQAHSETGNKGAIHYGVDPNQFTSYNGAASQVINEAGYTNILQILTGPSHLEIPGLIKQNTIVDCAFIDGWHTFDYTLVDFFLIDKVLKVGGYVAFHDTYGLAKQKVINFILTHRKYEIDDSLMNFTTEKRVKVLKMFLWRLIKYPALLFSKFHWKYQLKSSSGLIVLKKIENFEPNYDFFKDF